MTIIIVIVDVIRTATFNYELISKNFIFRLIKTSSLLLTDFFSLLAKRLAGKGVSEITCLWSSEMLNFNSVNQLIDFVPITLKSYFQQ